MSFRSSPRISNENFKSVKHLRARHSYVLFVVCFKRCKKQTFSTLPGFGCVLRLVYMTSPFISADHCWGGVCDRPKECLNLGGYIHPNPLHVQGLTIVFTAPFNNMRTLELKAQPTDAFFATINQMFSSSSKLLTTAEHCFVVWTVLNDLITGCSAVVGSWEEPPNIWLTVAKNAFVGWSLNFRVCMLLKGTVRTIPYVTLYNHYTWMSEVVKDKFYLRYYPAYIYYFTFFQKNVKHGMKKASKSQLTIFGGRRLDSFRRRTLIRLADYLYMYCSFCILPFKTEWGTSL